MELEAHIASLHKFGKCILIESLPNAAFVNSVIVFSAFPGSYANDIDKYDNSHPVMQKPSLLSDSDVPVLCTANESKSELDSRASKYSEIQMVFHRILMPKWIGNLMILTRL